MAKRKTNKSSSSKKTINKKPIKNEVNSKRKGNKKNNKTIRLINHNIKGEFTIKNMILIY